MTAAPIKPNTRMAPHSAVLPNEPVAISQSPMEPHTIAANTPMANKKRTPAFLPAVGWSGTGSRHLRQRRLRTANLIKRRMVDRSQVHVRLRSWGLLVASFFVVDARTQHTFLLGSPRHRKKAIPRASPYQVGLWKTHSFQARQPFRCRVEGAGGTAPVLGDEGKAVGMQSADGFAVCACHARPPLPAALVCRRTRRLLCRRIKWRA